MSLINDALKRANEQKAKQVSAGELGSTMQVVDSSTEETRLWPIALFAVLLVGALWLGWSGLHSGSNTGETGSTSAEVNARGPESAVTPSASAVAELPAKQPSASESGVAEPTRTTVVPPPRVLPPPEPPALAAKVASTAKADLPAVVPVLAPAPAPTVVPTVPPPPVAAVPAPNTFPQLSLQGIYYRPSRPSAVINSKTVFVGDKVQQVKVLAIDRYEVTVQWNNEVRVLAFQ